jgi:hypothetical protein
MTRPQGATLQHPDWIDNVVGLSAAMQRHLRRLDTSAGFVEKPRLLQLSDVLSLQGGRFAALQLRGLFPVLARHLA